jgi:hypothetical protein
MDAEKVEAVLAWSMSRMVSVVHGFLGLMGYYRKFIRSYGDIAATLTQLLKKEAFSWTPTAAFDALKMSLTTVPVLQLPDFTKPFMMDCNASGSGFGAVLHQGQNLEHGPKLGARPSSQWPSWPTTARSETVLRPVLALPSATGLAHRASNASAR